MSSATSFSPVWMFFISFSCLIAVVRTFSTMLNRSDGSRHPCLVSVLGGAAGPDFQPFTIKYGVSYGYFVAAFYQAE